MSQQLPAPSHVAFLNEQRVAQGSLAEVSGALRRAIDAAPDATPLVFDRARGAVVDVDLRGDAAEVAARLTPAPEPARRGRPRLGVAAREVTLLPRHWDWLAAQPGGASAALRRLVEAASRAPDDGRARRDAAYRFMSAMAGDRPGFEEASRALFAGDRAALADRAAAWPRDIADEVLGLLDGG